MGNSSRNVQVVIQVWNNKLMEDQNKYDYVKKNRGGNKFRP